MGQVADKLRPYVLGWKAYFGWRRRHGSKMHLIPYPSLALIKRCCQAAQVEAVMDSKIPG